MTASVLAAFGVLENSRFFRPITKAEWVCSYVPATPLPFKPDFSRRFVSIELQNYYTVFTITPFKTVKIRYKIFNKPNISVIFVESVKKRHKSKGELCVKISHRTDRRHVRRIPAALITVSVYILFLVIFQVCNPKKMVPGTQVRDNLEDAVVISVLNEQLNKSMIVPGYATGTQHLRIQILSGSMKGKTVEITNVLSTLENVHAKAGDHIVVSINRKLKNQPITVFNYQRAPVILVFVGLFFVLLWFLGGKKGPVSAIGVLLTAVTVFFFLLPMLYNGYSALWASVAAASVIVVVTMLLVGGWSTKTAVAILGSVLGTVVSGALCALLSSLLHISGVNIMEAEDLIVIGQTTGMHVDGLLFASVLIASLGAVMDISMTIASSIAELSAESRKSIRALFLSGLHISQDMMGTMSSTLILAFVGNSMGLLMMIYSFNVPFMQFINTNQVGMELIQGLTGSFSVVLSVPLVAYLAAKLYTLHPSAEKKKRIAASPSKPHEFT